MRSQYAVRSRGTYFQLKARREKKKKPQNGDVFEL